ncbi:MAG: Hsp70 family protein [Fuerstiella sp.]|nr:Hsp70 family protein [Fuerstiella sp.]
MKQTQAVGIDLGTTYSCIAWLNEHGHPVTIPNQEGELATPSVVFFDEHEPIVGTEALRNAIARPERVVQNAKRHMGNVDKFWRIGTNRYNPVQISGLILRKLIAAAQEQIGEISEAVVTVPAQFSDAQRHATVMAGHSAGLEKVEVINEPVAAALCHVLGNEGLAFTELAVDQQLLVYDLGGGTLDLAIVSYSSDQVRVVASDGDLELGGLDWTQVLVDIAAERFLMDFNEDPRQDPYSHQFLALEAEQAKRSLSVRPRAAVTVQHEGDRRTYQIEQEEFEHIGRSLLKRSNAITRRILADNDFGWAHVDVVLTTGGSSRMPMVRESLKKLSGRTLNSSLSPDQSIAHGAAYYAGMLLSNQEYTRTIFNSQASSRLSKIQQQSVNARGLGILVRDTETGNRVPHYLIPPNTALPTARTHVFGTVVAQQTKVHIRIVESGAGPGKPHSILGDCLITDLPTDLSEGSEVEVTISYDAQARVHVSARELKSGKSAETEIIRQENMSGQLQQEVDEASNVGQTVQAVTKSEPEKAETHSQDAESLAGPNDSVSDEWATVSAGLSEFSEFADPADSAEQPVLLCNSCGTVLSLKGRCSRCNSSPAGRKRHTGTKKKPARRPTASKPGMAGTAPAKRKRKKTAARKTAARKTAGKTAGKTTQKKRSPEDDFWDLVD